jgi:predicted transcriptional regulator
MKIKQYNYKNFPVVVEMSEHMGITFSASSYHLKSEHRKEHINGGWEKPDEAIKSIEKVIDAYLKNNPKTYEELAEHIHSSLIWTGYEDCYVEPKILKILIENFMLAQPQKL